MVKMTEEQPKKGQHGGKRDNAGRPRIGEPKRSIGVRLEPSDVSYLIQLGEGSISEGIRRLIARARDD